MARRCDGLLGTLLVLVLAPVAWAQQGTLDRTVLPIPEPKSPPIKELDTPKAKAPPRFEVKAPHVVIVFLYDTGFGQPSTFGRHKGPGS